MKRIIQNLKFICFILLIGTVLAACATTSYLNVTYQPPPESYALDGKEIFFDFKDMRTDKTVLSETAQKKLKNFTGIFSLTVASQGEKGPVVGAFYLPSLFQEAFTRSLVNMGAELLPEPKNDEPILEIVLKDFILDVVGRKWVASIRYETDLIKNGNLLASQNISGNAERYDLLGRKDADKLLGEIFTDIVNKLDIHKLFEQAGL
ncbi:MAG TPA: hypothetical protein PKV75_11250 [Desulfobacterales bacterium]|nr:hypothetical protein [Desulfobacterales bacterium]